MRGSSAGQKPPRRSRCCRAVSVDGRCTVSHVPEELRTSMSRRHLVALTILLAAGAACSGDGGPGPDLGFDHALVTPACGPADGPAVAFYLASHPIDARSPAPPYIRIVVWDAPATVAG